MPLRRRADARYGGGESPGQPSRERVDPGKADTAPKAAPGFRVGLPCLLAYGQLRRGAIVPIRGATPRRPRLPWLSPGPFGHGSWMQSRLPGETLGVYSAGVAGVPSGAGASAGVAGVPSGAGASAGAPGRAPA